MSEIALPIACAPELPGPVRLLSDERLARLVSRGSERAFATLYERHHQALYRYCLSIVRNPQDAQDALQSSLARALAALQASERDLAVRPWLFRIAHNEAVSILRKRRGADRVLDEQEPSLLSVERTFEERERLGRLVSDLQALPLRQRAALLMRELSGLSIEEIAAALATSPGAAKQTLFEARSSLQAFAEGREMECEAVRRAISDGDGRVLRSRQIRAHLRGCRDCEAFRALIADRSADLRALALPLPAIASAALLKQVLAHGAAGSHAGGLVASSASVLGGHTAGSLALKGLAGVAVLAAAGAGTAHLVSAPDRHAGAPAGSAARHVHQAGAPGAPGAAETRSAGLAPHAAAPGANGASRAPAASTSDSPPTPQGEASAASEAQRAATPGVAHAGNAKARGNAHRASGKDHRKSRAEHPRKPSRAPLQGDARHAKSPRPRSPARPERRAPANAGLTPQGLAPHDGLAEAERGAQADPPLRSPAAGAEVE
jgi:RNA polymerase sigma factor (sigma-70 family)